MRYITNGEKTNLIHADLSYKVIGALFDVWTTLGHGHKERIYQKAVAKSLTMGGIRFTEQAPAKLMYRGDAIGMYYFDFLIDDRLILELKVREYFSKHDIEQLYSYLKASSLKLGLIAHFTRSGVKFRRVVNLI